MAPRQIARLCFDAAVAAADPRAAVARALRDQPLPVVPGQTILIAIGKAALPMMETALEHLPDGARRRALAITNPENLRPLEDVAIFTGGHPEPNAEGMRGAGEIARVLRAATAQDYVLFLISGGGSALAPLPVAGVSLTDKIAVNRLLLEGGFDILETNLIRQQLSQFKGGGASAMATQAAQRALIISDVIGDDLRAVASGPTVAPLGDADAAKILLRDRGVWDQLPKSVQEHLLAPATPKPVGTCENQLICSNRQSLDAALAAAPEGFQATLINDQLTGDVTDAAQAILGHLNTLPADGPQIRVWGGETTVTLRGSGRGGRNQELALRVAAGAADLPGDWVFLSGGTDGRDGPTDAAGGVVDSGTVGRIAAAGGSLSDLLANNDSYSALGLASDLLITGGTGTNVADVQVFVRL